MEDMVVMETHGLVGQKSFTMKNSVKAFNILSDSLYMNKALAVIRELSTNAYDAHIAAGTQDVPFEIHLPNEVAPYFYIRDFGTGLDDDQVLNLYTTYFDSTKSDSVDATGALGLGSKSPFSVVDDFTVVSYQGGKARTYFAYKNEEGFPCISFVSENDADELNGIKIQFAVRRDKYNEFKVNLPMAIYHFNPKPAILNVPVNVAKENIGLHGEDWEIAENNGTGYYLGDKPFVVMARISYPIDVLQLEHLFDEEDLYLLSLCKVPLRIYVENRHVDHTPSREHLQYTKKTVRTILAHLKKIHEVLMERINEEFGDCSSLAEIEERCFFLREVDETNIKVEPWKSMKRSFGISEFKHFGKLFNHPVDVKLKGGLTVKVNLYSLYEQNPHRRPAWPAAVTLGEITEQGVAAEHVARAWRRLLIKTIDKWQSSTNTVPTEEELLESSQRIGKDLETTRNQILRSLKEKLKSPLYDANYVNFTEKFLSTVDDFGNMKTSWMFNTKATSIAVSIKRRNIRLGFIIDDYPKDVSANIRAGFMRAVKRNYVDYLVVTHAHRSGGRFDKDEMAAVELTVKQIAKYLDAEVIKASEVVVPEVFKIAEPKTYMAKNEYCAFNILTFSGDVTTNIPAAVSNLSEPKFKEVPADQMGEDFKLPSFEENNVVYIRRQYNQMDLFGIEGDRQHIRHEYKVGDSEFHELADIIRIFSVFSGEYLLKDKVFVVIKTKSQFEKAQKGKWVSFTDLLKKTINGLSDTRLRQLVTFLSFANRLGISECSKTIAAFNKLATGKVFNSAVSPEQIARAPMSAICGVTAHLFSTAKKIGVKEIEDQLATINDLPDCTYKKLLNDAVKFYELNAKLKADSKMFDEFTMDTGSYGFYSGAAKGVIVNSNYISQILSFVLDEKYYVQAKKVMIKCQEVVKKYPLIGTYSSKFTKDESKWVSSNIPRAAELFPSVIQYIKLVEGV